MGAASSRATKTKEQKEKEKEEKAAIAAKEKERQRVIKRQQKLLKEEINQSWRIVFGENIPNKQSIYVISNVTLRNIWMEDLYLYNQIKNLKTDELFHPCDSYILKWRPPGSFYQLVIPLSDIRIQESVILEIAKLSWFRPAKVIFHFVPILTTIPMFAMKTHPATLVSFHSKNSVLKKLADLFLEGRISITELQQIFTNDFEIWKVALYNLLPVDWQPYHEYLNTPPPPVTTERDIEKSYLNEDISLKQYEEFKYPERKELNEIKSRQYPLAGQFITCIICGEPNVGIVPCQNCDNMACVKCVQKTFLDENGQEKGSFMLMHHKYCLRLGSLKPIALELQLEPAYLRQFRSTSRSAVLAMLMPQKTSTDDVTQKEEDDEDEEEEEARRQAELERQRIAEEEELLQQRERPPELLALRMAFEDNMNRFHKLLKEIKSLQKKMDDNGHTDQFIQRNKRLQQEVIDKIRKAVLKPVEKIHASAVDLDIPGNFRLMLVDEAIAALTLMGRVLDLDLELFRSD